MHRFRDFVYKTYKHIARQAQELTIITLLFAFCVFFYKYASTDSILLVPFFTILKSTWLPQLFGILFVICFLLFITFLIIFVVGFLAGWNKEEEVKVQPEIRARNKGTRITIDEKAKTITLEVGDSYKVDTKKKQQGKKQR